MDGHRLDLRLEEALGRFDGLRADLGGELHRKLRVLDRRNRRLRVCDLAGREVDLLLLRDKAARIRHSTDVSWDGRFGCFMEYRPIEGLENRYLQSS